MYIPQTEQCNKAIRSTDHIVFCPIPVPLVAKLNVKQNDSATTFIDVGQARCRVNLKKKINNFFRYQYRLTPVVAKM